MQEFRSASTHVTGGRTGGIMGMLGPLCELTSGHLPQGRPAPKLAGDGPKHQRALTQKKLDRPQLFFLTVSSSSVSCRRSVGRLPR